MNNMGVKMKSILNLKNKKGQGLVEYVLVILMVAVIAAVAIRYLSTNFNIGNYLRCVVQVASGNQYTNGSVTVRAWEVGQCARVLMQ